MSIIGSFANKVFKVSSNHLYTFDEFTMSGELKVDEQEVDNSKPSSYIKGPGLDKVSLNILLIKQKNVNVRNEIQDWFKIRDAKTPHHLIIGNKNLSTDKFLLTSVNTSDTKIGPGGEFLKSTLQLQFSEYVRAGKKENNSTSASSSSSSSSKSKAGTSKSSKQTKKRSTKSSSSKSKSSSNKSSSNKSNAKLEALEKELYG